MLSTSLDLTIESALGDPLVAAAMRADRVDPRWLKDLLTMAARRLDGECSREPTPLASPAGQVPVASAGCCQGW